MNTTKEKFLLDTNTFITPFKEYYSFTIAPSYWSFLEKGIADKKIAILDLVYHEISKGTDSLSNWVKCLNTAKVDHRDSAILKVYGDIMKYIDESPSYNDKALTEWAAGTRADAWLVAAASALGYTVITFERPNQSLGTSKTSHPKIPDVCMAFNVKCENLYYVLNLSGFSF